MASVRVFLQFHIHTWSVENSLWTLTMTTVCSKFYFPVSILGPRLFNVFINDLFDFIKDAQLLSFADDNAIATLSNSVDNLIPEAQKESENVIDWFPLNEMVENPDKFQAWKIKELLRASNL